MLTLWREYDTTYAVSSSGEVLNKTTGRMEDIVEENGDLIVRVGKRFVSVAELMHRPHACVSGKLVPLFELKKYGDHDLQGYFIDKKGGLYHARKPLTCRHSENKNFYIVGEKIKIS